MGWQEYDPSKHAKEDVRLIFVKRPKISELGTFLVHPNTRVNHFPLAGYFCIKDQLYRMLKKQRALFGNVYNFVPLTFILPNDYSKFIDTFTKRNMADSTKRNPTNDQFIKDD